MTRDWSTLSRKDIVAARTVSKRDEISIDGGGQNRRSHLEADIYRRENEVVGAGHELEPAVALDQPRDVREPAGVDVEVFVHLVRREARTEGK